MSKQTSEYHLSCPAKAGIQINPLDAGFRRNDALDYATGNYTPKQIMIKMFQ